MCNGENDSLLDSIFADRPLSSKPVIKKDKFLLGKFI